MIVRQPKKSDDRPPIVSSSIVGALGLAAGLWLAHATMAHPAPEIAEAEAIELAELASPPPEAVDGQSTGDGEGERTGDRDGDGDGAGEGDGDGDGPTTPASATPASTTPASTTPVAAPVVPRPPPPIGHGTATRVRHGRVAYLRCDGAPVVPGPFPCPRDAALEASVWAAVDQLLACDPPLPPGQADLVVEFDREAGATAPTIATRDTFPDDAIRTDAAAVVTCLTPPLSTLTTAIPGDRIRVGFRFSLD